MDLQELINDKKEENLTKKELFLSSVLASAYVGLLTIKPIRKWVNDSKSSQEFKEKVRRLSHKVIIPSSILNIPKKFNIPNLVNMVTGSPKETDYNTLLNSNTIGINSESVRISNKRDKVLNNIIDFKENILPNKTNLNNRFNIFDTLSMIDYRKNILHDSFKNTIKRDYKNQLKLEGLINKRVDSIKSNSDLMNKLKNKIAELKQLKVNRELMFSAIKNLYGIYNRNIKYYSTKLNSIDEKIKLIHNNDYLNFKNQYLSDLKVNNNILNEEFLNKYDIEYRNMLDVERRFRGTIFYHLYHNEEFQNYLRQHNKNYIYKSTKKYRDKTGVLHSYIYNLKYNYNIFLNDNNDNILKQLGLSKYQFIHKAIDNDILSNAYYNYRYDTTLLPFLNKKERLNRIKENNITILNNLSENIKSNKSQLNKTIKKYINDVDKYSKYLGYRQQTINKMYSKESLYNSIKLKYNKLEDTIEQIDNFKKYINNLYNQVPTVDVLNNIDNIDDLRNVQNLIKYTNQVNYVYSSYINSFLRKVNTKSYLANKAKGFYSNINKTLKYFDKINSFLENDNIINTLNKYKVGDKIDLLKTQDIFDNNTKIWTFNKQLIADGKKYRVNLDNVKAYVEKYVTDQSPNQIMSRQINTHIGLLKKRAVKYGYNSEIFNPLVDRLFGDYTSKAGNKNRINFVEDLIRVVAEHNSVKEVSLQTKQISNSLLLNFNITSLDGISFDVNVPVPNFTGVLQTGTSAATIVNQSRYLPKLKSIWYKWVNSYFGRLDPEFTKNMTKSELQEYYQKTRKTITKQISSLNAALGISSENPFQDLINGFTIKGDIGSIFEHLSNEEQETLKRNFSLIKRLQGKDSKYKKVFLDLEFQSDINPLDKKGMLNDIEELGMIAFDANGDLEFVDNYWSTNFKKSKQSAAGDTISYFSKKLPKQTINTKFNHQKELAKLFLERFDLNEIDNLIFISKANIINNKHGDLDRLIGMLRDYSDIASIEEKEKINKLIPRLNQEMNYINFQPFMTQSKFSIWDYTDIGSKKGEVLEQEIFEIYLNARKSKDYKKISYIRNILQDRSPKLFENIQTALKNNRPNLSSYTHHAVDDTLIMTMYFDIVKYDMQKYKNFEDWKQSKEIPKKYLQLFWSQNLSNSQNIWRGNIHPFDLRTLFGQNDAYTRNKLRHYFNAEKFNISLDDKKFIPVSQDVLNLHKFNIGSEEFYNFFTETTTGKVVNLSDSIYKANVFHAIKPVGGLWEGAIAYNVNTIGKVTIQNKRTDKVVVKVKDGLKVNDIIQPNEVIGINDLNSSFIGKKENDALYFNLSNKPKKVVSITPDKNGYCIVELQDVVKMGIGQKITVNGVSGLLDEAMNSPYDLMMYSKAWGSSNRKNIVDEMLGRAIKLAEAKRLKDGFSSDSYLETELRKIKYLSNVKFFTGNERIEVVTKTLNNKLQTNIRELDEAISQIGNFLKKNFPVYQYLDEKFNMNVEMSKGVTDNSLLSTKKMSVSEWGQIIAKDVHKLTSQYDMVNEKIIQNLLISISDDKYRTKIENLFGVQNFYNHLNDPEKKLKTGQYRLKEKAFKDRLQLLKDIFTDKNTGFLFELLGLNSHGRPNYITGISGYNGAGFIYDEMQGSHTAGTLRESPLFLKIAGMNAATDETLNVYKQHAVYGADPRTNYNIRSEFSTNKSIKANINQMVNLNKLFETNKSFSDFLIQTLNNSINKDSAIYDAGKIVGYELQDSNVIKHLNVDQVNTLKTLYKKVLNSKGAYYEKNGQKYWLSSDELLIRNTEHKGEYLVSRQFNNLIKLMSDVNYNVKNALSDEWDFISKLKAKEVATAKIPGQSIGFTSGDEITLQDFNYHYKRFKNNTDAAMKEMVKNFKLGRSLFAGEIIQTNSSIKNIANFNEYINASTIKDIKQDILYLVDYDKYINNIKNPNDKFFVDDSFLQHYKHKTEVARLNNLRWEAIYEAEKTGTGVYSKATKEFYRRHKQKFSTFLKEVMNTANDNIDNLVDYREKLASAVELEMLSMRGVGVKFPAGSASIYENSRVYIHIDEDTDRPMLLSTNLAVDLSKKDFDGDIVNMITALSSDSRMDSAFNYFEKDYLKSKERISMLKKNGLLKRNDLGLEIIDGSRVFNIADSKNYNEVRDKLKEKISFKDSKIAEDNSKTVYTKKYAAEAFRKGSFGLYILNKVKYGKNKQLDNEALNILWSNYMAPIVETPLAMNKFPTEVNKMFNMLDKSLTVYGRKEIRKYLNNEDPVIRAQYQTFNKFLSKPIQRLTTDGTSTGKIYNQSLDNFFTELFGAKYDNNNIAFLTSDSEYYKYLSTSPSEFKISGGKTVYGKSIDALDLFALLTEVTYKQGTNQTIKRDFALQLGSGTVEQASRYFEKYGINPFDFDNSLLVHTARNEVKENQIFTKFLSSSKKFISKNKKLSASILGGALVASFIAGNTLGETPGEYISNDLFYGSHDNEANYSELMNQAIYSPSLNTRLHLASPTYQPKIDYAGYSSKLIQSYNPNPIQTQQVRTMPLIFN